MPYPNGGSPWQDASQAVSGLGNTLQGVTVGMAQLRAQQEVARQNYLMHMQQLQQQSELNKSHSKLYEQQGALYIAQKALLDSKVKNADQRGQEDQILGDLVDFLGRNPGMAPEERVPYESKLASIVARRAASGITGAQHVPTSMAQITSMQQVPGMREIIAAGGAGHLYNNVAAGGTGYSPAGFPQINAGFNAPQGSLHFPAQVLDTTLKTEPSPLVSNAAGLAPRTGMDTETSKNLGRGVELLKNLAPGGFVSEAVKQSPMYNMATNLIQRAGGKAMESMGQKAPATGVPDKQAAIKEAQGIIQSRPDLAPRIKERFKQTFGEDLP